MTTVAKPWNRVGRRSDDAQVPAWLVPLADAVDGVEVGRLTRFVPPDGVGRHAAVLCLFAMGTPGPSVVLIQRAARMRAHAGQPAFPGGAVDAADGDAIDAALREAAEETDLDPSGVAVFGTLPDLWVPVTGFVVTPVLGWWHTPGPIRAADQREVAHVHRVSIDELVDPSNRVLVRHSSGYIGPGFTVRGMTVWGFTAGLLTGLLDLGRWSVPWQPNRTVALVEPG